MGSLTDKQLSFCYEYLIDLNATQAAIRAGYSKKTARKIGCENLSKPDIQDKITILTSKRNEDASTTSLDVLNRLVEIDSLDVADILNDDGSMLAINQWPKAWRVSISGVDISEIASIKEGSDLQAIIKKIKWPDKLRNLEMIGRHVNVGAWNNEHNAVDKIKPITIQIINPNESSD